MLYPILSVPPPSTFVVEGEPDQTPDVSPELVVSSIEVPSVNKNSTLAVACKVEENNDSNASDAIEGINFIIM